MRRLIESPKTSNKMTPGLKELDKVCTDVEILLIIFAERYCVLVSDRYRILEDQPRVSQVMVAKYIREISVKMAIASGRRQVVEHGILKPRN